MTDNEKRDDFNKSLEDSSKTQSKFNMPENHKETVTIDGESFPFIVFPSADDEADLVDAMKENSGSCRKAMASYIQKQLDVDDNKKPSIDRIVAQDDTLFTTVINLLLDDEEDIKVLYEANVGDADICHRFIVAIDTVFANKINHMMTIAKIPDAATIP